MVKKVMHVPVLAGQSHSCRVYGKEWAQVSLQRLFLEDGIGQRSGWGGGFAPCIFKSYFKLYTQEHSPFLLLRIEL